MQNAFLIDCGGGIVDKKVRLGPLETSSSASKWPIYFINNFVASTAKQNLFVRRTFVYVILYVVDFLKFFTMLRLNYQRVHEFWSSISTLFTYH